MNKSPYTNSLFEQPWWLDLVAPGAWSEVCVKDNNGEILARMPYFLNGRGISLPFMTQNIGIWFNETVSKSYEKQKKCICEILGKLPAVSYVRLALSPKNGYVLPFRWSGFSLEVAYTYRLENLNSEDEIFNSFDAKLRADIRRAQKRYTTNQKGNPQDLMTLCDKTFALQHRKFPHNKEKLCKIIDYCQKHDCGECIEARNEEGELLAAAFFVYDDEVCYYLIGARDPSIKQSKTIELLLWEGIHLAMQKSKVFDFEGSMVEGIEGFYSKFGGRCAPYYVVRKDTLLGDVLHILKPRIKKLIGYKI